MEIIYEQHIGPPIVFTILRVVWIPQRAAGKRGKDQRAQKYNETIHRP